MTPSSYIGAKQIFDEGSKYYRNIRYIADIEEPDYTDSDWRAWAREHAGELNAGTFYYRHNKEWDGILPDSLRESMYCFFMANVVRDLRGQSTAPRSMLINMSRFVKVQNVIKYEVERIYEEFKSIVEKDFSDNPSKNTSLPLYAELKRLWDKYYGFVSDISFERVVDKKNLYGAIENIHNQIIAERDKGKAILLISLELDEVMGLADTIAVIYNGQILKVADAKSLTVEEVGQFMMGVTE